MPNIQEILKQIQRDLSCPVCGGKFEMRDIKIRGTLDHILVFQTVCTEGHLTLFMTVFQANKKTPVKALTTDEVLDLDSAIDNFDGDFEKQWKQ